MSHFAKIVIAVGLIALAPAFSDEEHTIEPPASAEKNPATINGKLNAACTAGMDGCYASCTPLAYPVNHVCVDNCRVSYNVCVALANKGASLSK